MEVENTNLFPLCVYLVLFFQSTLRFFSDRLILIRFIHLSPHLLAMSPKKADIGRLPNCQQQQSQSSFKLFSCTSIVTTTPIIQIPQL